jgi:membrane protein DedA with SNARE-associated domain
MGRLIPGIRCQTSIAAGVFHVRRRVFLCSTAVAALIWTSFYLGMGFLLGNGSVWIAGYLGNPYILVALPLTILTVFAGFKVMRGRQRPEKGAGVQPDARLVPAGVTA